MESGASHNGQSGSIVNFIVIGVALVALVVGGVYILRKGTNDPVAVNPSPSASPSTSSVSPKPTSPSSSPKPSASPSHPPTGNSRLPTSGPVDGLTTALILALLTGVTTAYLRSRKLAYELSLQR